MLQTTHARAFEVPQRNSSRNYFVASARMHSFVNLTDYLTNPTSLVTVRETVYILGGNASFYDINQPPYASIIVISSFDSELHAVTQLHDEGKHLFDFSPKRDFSSCAIHFLIYIDRSKCPTPSGRMTTQRSRSTCRYKRLLKERGVLSNWPSV